MIIIYSLFPPLSPLRSVIYCAYAVFASFMRFVTYHELKIDQKKVYSIRHHVGIIADIGRFVKVRQNVRNFVI